LWDVDESSDDVDTTNGSPLNVGYKVVDMIVETYENEHSILREFPTGDLNPQPFVDGARRKMEKVAAAVRLKHGMDFPGAVVQWDAFLAMAPQSDDVFEFIADNPLYIPFKEELFDISSDNSRYAHSRSGLPSAHIRQQDEDTAARAKGDDAEVWRTMPCMDKNAPEAFERVMAIRDDDGNATFRPYYCDGNDSSDEASSDEAMSEEEEDVESEECSSEDDEDSKLGRWCTVRRNGNITRLGDTLKYVGLPFERKRIEQFTTKDDYESGTIVSVQRNSHVLTGALHFALQSADSKVDHLTMVPCKVIMSVGRKNIYKVRLSTNII
jgi:hypothetical protein